MDSFAAYAAATRSTAFYPGAEGNGKHSLLALSYLGLGLAGESGEVADKVKKVIRDSNSDIDFDRREGILMEVGDVLWYATRICDHLGVSVSSVVCSDHLDSFDAYQDQVNIAVAQFTHPYLAGSVSELAYLSLLLTAKSGAVSDRISESVIGGEMVDVRLLEPVLHTLTRIVTNLGGTLSDVATRNVTKLEGRQSRGVLHGSGDKR